MLKVRRRTPIVQHDNRRRGFTLIELLVVVLIIGILAAVAVPQYQKAVVKARFAEAITVLKSIKQAKDICYISTGDGCDNFDQLDIDFGERKKGVEDAGFDTKHFSFFTVDPDWGAAGPAAGYKDEDVCLCYYNPNVTMDEQTLENSLHSVLVVSQNQGCADKEASFDYAQLLNLPDVGENCTCC